jgi:HEAT repeat protein
MARLTTTTVKPVRIQNAVFVLLKATQILIVSLIWGVAVAAQSAAPDTSSSSDGLLSMLFGGYGITILLGLVLVGLFIAKKIRSSRGGWENVEEEPKVMPQPQKSALPTVHRSQAHPREEVDPEHRQTGPQWESPVPHEADSAFGAYRVDQEVWKLVLGKAHRMDVMASRVPDDRRAIEASLVKALTSFDTDEEARCRARQALEEYGFLARQSAVLLAGRDAWERSSAARMIGQIGSPSSLPFLIEALHDNDVVVRNQAVSSLGALQLPAAIGALLDTARRHPDIPAQLLSEALSACSVETAVFLDVPSSEPGLLSEGTFSEQSAELQSFVAFDDLPDGTEDSLLADLLAQLTSPAEQVRTEAAQQLGLHPVQASVSALASAAMHDPEKAVRSAAVTSLGLIDHESVFAPVLIALADESREVQAAAARALTSLRFDRGDAYVRVIETSDPQTLQNVARACLKIGIISQAVDRLASEDRRQAYESFSLFSLLARANEVEPILDTIENHVDENVRLCAVRVLNVAARPEVAPRLREMVTNENMSENLRTALLEVLYKLDQNQPVDVLATSDNTTSDVA